MAPRETENNAHAKFWGDKQRALWYVMVFSGVVNCTITSFYTTTRILQFVVFLCKLGLLFFKPHLN